jgi:hypothetical protein
VFFFHNMKGSMDNINSYLVEDHNDFRKKKTSLIIYKSTAQDPKATIETEEKLLCKVQKRIQDFWKWLGIFYAFAATISAFLLYRG